MTQTGSARFDGDTWDLASSVGLTATMVASARALASRIPGALINDQFAEPLVRAVGVDYFARLAGGELDLGDLDDGAAKALRRFADAPTSCKAIRTRFFDEFFLDAARAGIRQAVILASGLDSRAYRLAWTSEPMEPSGTTVFEVDQPQVIDFKTTTLEGLGAQPTADRRAARGRHRLTRRLAGGAAPGGLRPDAADGLDRRGAAGVSARRGPRPAARPAHRAERAGQPVRHRRAARHQ
ncbi:MAG: hypothetical protein QOH91_2929 [Mycobacterium sp.]|nr:hypothetical protein [Mycobacterium sp.]